MNTKQGWPIGVCSWSLQCDGAKLADAMHVLGLRHIHLAFGEPAQAEWTATSTMIAFPQEDYTTLDSIRRTGGVAPDAEWPGNRRLFRAAARITGDLRVPYLSMHAGFLDHTDASYAAKFYDRIRSLADIAGERGLTLLLETGQESAADLRRFMEEMEHPALGINFDPANMILYDKDDPQDAVRILAPWVRHVHIKDAIRTRRRGEWGIEVPWGEGEVGARSFLSALQDMGYGGVVAVEREAGDNRLGDIRLAVERLTVGLG